MRRLRDRIGYVLFLCSAKTIFRRDADPLTTVDRLRDQDGNSDNRLVAAGLLMIVLILSKVLG